MSTPNLNTVAVVFQDNDGKARARMLTVWEANLVLGQLQALDGGTLHAREVTPFELRSVKPNLTVVKDDD